MCQIAYITKNKPYCTNDHLWLYQFLFKGFLLLLRLIHKFILSRRFSIKTKICPLFSGLSIQEKWWITTYIHPLRWFMSSLVESANSLPPNSEYKKSCLHSFLKIFNSVQWLKWEKFMFVSAELWYHIVYRQSSSNICISSWFENNTLFVKSAFILVNNGWLWCLASIRPIRKDQNGNKKKSELIMETVS